jgi:hypothetical protein
MKEPRHTPVRRVYAFETWRTMCAALVLVQNVNQRAGGGRKNNGGEKYESSKGVPELCGFAVEDILHCANGVVHWQTAITCIESIGLCERASGTSIAACSCLPATGHSFTAVMSLGELPAFATQAAFASVASSAARKQSATPQMIRRTGCNSKTSPAQSLSLVWMPNLSGSVVFPHARLPPG